MHNAMKKIQRLTRCRNNKSFVQKVFDVTTCYEEPGNQLLLFYLSSVQLGCFVFALLALYMQIQKR